MMNKILILFAHPAVKKSKVNAALRSAAHDLENVTFHDLYARYPEFLIDIEEEQRLCETHDVLIMQHPFYWYSTPSLLKEWQDLVLEHSWAYGSQGTALHGKIFLQALTAGGGEETYRPEGANHFTIQELTAPLRATANLCGMTWLPPFAVLGVHRGLHPDALTKHAEDYRRTLIALRDEKLDVPAALQMERLNQDLDEVIK